MPRRFPILEMTDHYVVIAKPAGLIVHRSRMARDRANILKLLRRQIERYLHPVHRLDRQVSGCLLFAFDSEWAAELQAAMQASDARKTYLAWVRGYVQTLDPMPIDRPIKDERGVEKEARSIVQCVGRCHEPRNSLVKVWPETGRYHQVRRHVRDLNHPVLGDAMHGDTKFNRWWRESYPLPRLGVHCLSLDLPLPTGRLQVTCPVPDDLRDIWQTMPWWEEATERVPELLLPHPPPPDRPRDDVEE